MDGVPVGDELYQADVADDAKSRLSIRSATDADVILFYRLRRAVAGVPGATSELTPVTWEEHITWFTDRVAEIAQHRWFVGEVNGQPIGIVRLDQYPLYTAGVPLTFEWRVSLIIDPREQRKGYGMALLFMVPKPETGRITALIHPLNKASQRTFTRAGYIEVGRDRAHREGWLIYEC
mgnify:FL=1